MLKNNYKDEDYIHYVYKITNKNNNKYYIGIHSFPKDLGYTPLTDGYWGSGSEITKAIKTEGRENFKKEILGVFSTREEISLEEQKLVTIEVVRSVDSYNLILGGDSKYESSIGWVICRPKSALNKVIKITREEYYSNKELYIPTGHLKYYLETKDMTDEQILKRKEKNYTTHAYKRKEKVDYVVVKQFVDKDTLEIRTLKVKDVLEPYESWYPQYFLDKSSNTFITKEYLVNEFKKLPNIGKLSKKFKISFRSLKNIIKYYDIEDDLYGINNKVKSSGLGFTGWIYMNNGTTEIRIKIEDEGKYISSGYKRGKLPSNSVSQDELYNFYVLGNGIKSCIKKFKISEKQVKDLLNLNDGYKQWFHSKNLSKSICVIVSGENMVNDFFDNGWELGRKVFKTP